MWIIQKRVIVHVRMVFHFRSKTSNYVQIRITSMKRKRQAGSCLKGWQSEVVLFALNIRAYLWKYRARGQVAEWGSWCQISLELVLGVVFRKLALEWCCWHPRAGLLFSLAALCLIRLDMHREVGDRSLHQHTKPAEGSVGWCSRGKAVSRM